MIDTGITFLRAPLMLILLGLPPLLLLTRGTRQRSHHQRLCTGGILLVIHVLLVALALHTARVAITPSSLACSHLIILGAALLRHIRQSRKGTGNRPDSAPPPPPWRNTTRGAALLLCLLLLPYTHFTGVDTYKWQDLATSVRMEQALPWVVHPLSILGFTPRAYPPAHPVLLATVQILGGLGVGAGFAVVSVFTAILGMASATLLASRLLPPAPAALAGLLYGFSPVFVRYAHWATGRGLFLALFPALVALLLIPSSPPAEHPAGSDRWRRYGTAAVLSLLLLMTHKVALVALPLLLLSALVAPLLPRRMPLALCIGITLPFCALAVAMGAHGGAIQSVWALARTALLRFGWLLPAALAGLWTIPGGTSTTTDKRAFWLAALPAVALAFERQMYGALYALPFACIAATAAINRLCNAAPRTRRLLLGGLATLTLLAAVATVVERSSHACSPALYRAAMFLETHDPEGPFMIHAPGQHRTRIQAYVSGCARFNVSPGQQVRPPSGSVFIPHGGASLRQTVDAWATALRGLFTLENTVTDWYGSPRREYHFIINNEGSAPPDALLIYNQENIRIRQRVPMHPP